MPDGKLGPSSFRLSCPALDTFHFTLSVQPYMISDYSFLLSKRINCGGSLYGRRVTANQRAELFAGQQHLLPAFWSSRAGFVGDFDKELIWSNQLILKM